MDSLVSVVSCADYDEGRVADSISRCIDNLGGLGPFFTESKGVLVKPNLLSPNPPEKGITTHPSLVKAVSAILKEKGCRVSIGDSHGGYERRTEELWAKTGMKRAAEEAGVPLVNFEARGAVMRKIGHREYPLSRAVCDTDLLVSLPRLKTHIVTALTGAVKNTFGCVPGFRKATYHRDTHTVREFSELLVDVCQLSAPALTIMDAVVSMDGNGPAAGRLRNTGMILASRSPYALDMAASFLISAEENSIPTVRIAKRRGLGPNRTKKIEFVGDDPYRLRIRDFGVPRGGDLPPVLASVVGRALWVRPRIDPSKCTACGDCVRDCPVGAVRVVSDRAVIDLRRCISCFCCQEMCPGSAISAMKSRHLRLLRR
jgi:uncharacterized protein (DUF362 family)/Pyruvate/2-oxoacid:ferredoxin oxidoreductase delta subunit